MNLGLVFVGEDSISPKVSHERTLTSSPKSVHSFLWFEMGIVVIRSLTIKISQ
jgi:hypothetical protein